MERRGAAAGRNDAKRLLLAVIPLVKEGAKTILDLDDLCRFALAHRPLTLDDKSRTLLTDETRERLARLAQHLAREDDWTPPALTASLRAFAAIEGVGLGKFGGACAAFSPAACPPPTSPAP